MNQVLGWVALGEIPFPLFVFPSPDYTFTSVLQNPLCLSPSTVSASLFPFIYPIKHQNPHSKILSYFLAFSACFVILSISVEGLFFLSYSALLVVWVEVEAAIRSSPSQPNVTTETGRRVMGGKTRLARHQPRADDLRIALFFLFFVQVGFFGTGNVASIS